MAEFSTNRLSGKLFATATGVIVLYGAVKRVTGRHDWDPWPLPEGPWPKSDYSWDTKDTDHPVFGWLFQIHLKVNYALNCIEGVGIGVVRLAFLFLFRKLFRHQGRRYIILIDVLIAFVAAFMLVYTLVAIFMCGIHFEAQWTNHDTSKQYCFTSITYSFWVSVVTAILDMTVFLVPMYPLSKITSTCTHQAEKGVQSWGDVTDPSAL
ncbi:CFEM domain-containing protein [Colletotrichum higginsianum IMI 349063]|uniref:CFEM domain-containing protein n=1 Tax=Colletotrichum higginsianum (strain IMI 349063) TaxID=759273 RepID=A0A1B7XU49_COLHI|nr:CFEM domain-containing protein [Colletotrichum higginsianum IMI 349063]OBR03254.1 CFEM domain-containing protein [Colletotrichum higginsianum IMI 349063]